MVFFSATVFFCTSDVSVSCLGNAASRKEIYHGVNHTQKHGREVFTPKLIAFEPIRKRTKNRCAYYPDQSLGHFQTRSHIKENVKSVQQKCEFSTKFLLACIGPTVKEEGPWLFDISVIMDRPKLVISSEPCPAFP